MYYQPLFFGERNKPFLMGFHPNKNLGIRWSEAMSLINSILSSRNNIIWRKVLH